MGRGNFIWLCVVYKALGGTLRMDFTGAFLELWLVMEGKHVAIPGFSLVSGTSVSVRVVARTNGLHSIMQS